MESLNNQQTNGNPSAPGSNVELNLLGIDKKWVRHQGSWVDKSTIPVEPMQKKEIPTTFEESEGSASAWWQFWRA